MEEDIITKDTIEKGMIFLKKEYDYFNDINLYFNEDDENLIVILYPGEEEECISLDYKDFDYLICELGKFKIVTDGLFHTTWSSYQIVRFENEDIHYYLLKRTDFEKTFELGTIRILDNLDILRFASMKLDVYHKESGSFHQHYPAVQIEYEDKRNRLNHNDERKLILSYLFEISDSTGYNISLSKFRIPNRELENQVDKLIAPMDPLNPEVKHSVKLKPLLEYNEGMDLFISALQVNDESLKFLNFYKIIEYFAPIIIRSEGNALLVSKLETPKVLDPDRNFIDSIFELVNSVKENQKDSELGKIVLKYIDILDSVELLPKKILKHALKSANIQTLNYETPKDKSSIMINVISSVLYSTRNEVVHAKSNYKLTGNESNIDELEQLNKFMKQITAKLIRFYNRLPNHQK